MTVFLLFRYVRNNNLEISCDTRIYYIIGKNNSFIDYLSVECVKTKYNDRNKFLKGI